MSADPTPPTDTPGPASDEAMADVAAAVPSLPSPPAMPPDRPPVRMLVSPLYFPGKPDGRIVFPENLSPDDLPALDALLAYLRAIAKLNGARNAAR